MKFGLMFANTGHHATAEGVAELGAAAEAGGIESIWTVEHVIWPEHYSSRYPYSASGKMAGTPATPIPDPLVWLAFFAAQTSAVKLATGILILPQRNPLLTAKAAATLDVLSGGRLILGIGVGWLEEEFDALGVPFADRGPRTDDYVAAMRALWSGDGVSYEGEFASFHEVSVNPKPVGGDIPIVVGGHTKAAARRAGRLGAGFYPATASLDMLPELIDVARQTAADHGHDPASIEITTGHAGLLRDDPVGAAQELAALGVGRAMLAAYRLPAGAAAEKAQEWKETIVDPCAEI